MPTFEVSNYGVYSVRGARIGPTATTGRGELPDYAFSWARHIRIEFSPRRHALAPTHGGGRMLRRLTLASLITIAVVAFTAGPAFGYNLANRWFNTSAIDTNGDGRFDLSVCYGLSATDPIYVNRSALAIGIAQWADASPGAFTSNGICNSDGSNIEVLWKDNTICVSGSNMVFGSTEPKTGGYSTIKVFFNAKCERDGIFDWGGTISAGKHSAVSTLLHEVGHALGISHSDVNTAAMDDLGPDNCATFGQRYSLSRDDAEAFRDRYPGIIDTAIVFQNFAGCHD
jgi:hypothetical protein